MSSRFQWITAPQSDLRLRQNWKALGGNRFSALRVHLLAVKSKEDDERWGAIEKVYQVGPGETVEYEVCHGHVISHTDTISQGISFGVTESLLESVTAKLQAELAATSLLVSGKLAAQLEGNVGTEVRQSVSSSLSDSSSFSIQTSSEEKLKLSFRGSNTPTRITLRKLYWPCHWDIYLHSYEFLHLKYSKSWYEKNYTRDVIESVGSKTVAIPLLRVTFYEPQEHPVICHQHDVSALRYPDSIHISRLKVDMPRGTRRPKISIVDDASIAFPTNAEERKRSELILSSTYVMGKHGTYGGGVVSKKTARRKGTKKAARKRVTGKKATKKSARRKTIKKTTHKKVTKKSSRRK